MSFPFTNRTLIIYDDFYIHPINGMWKYSTIHEWNYCVLLVGKSLVNVAIISSGSSSYSIYNNTNETMQTKSHC